MHGLGPVERLQLSSACHVTVGGVPRTLSLLMASDPVPRESTLSCETGDTVTVMSRLLTAPHAPLEDQLMVNC
jgi:hypothetical protein